MLRRSRLRHAVEDRPIDPRVPLGSVNAQRKFGRPPIPTRGAHQVAGANLHFPKSRAHACLMCHTGAQIPGNYPRLEGTGDTGRVMKIASLADAEAAKR